RVGNGAPPWNPSVRPVRQATTEWTFRSAAPQAPDSVCPGSVGGGCVHQPLIQVRYRLGLDLFNRAPAGVPFTFGVSVQLPAGAAGGGANGGPWLWASARAGGPLPPPPDTPLPPRPCPVTPDKPPAPPAARAG